MVLASFAGAGKDVEALFTGRNSVWFHWQSGDWFQAQLFKIRLVSRLPETYLDKLGWVLWSFIFLTCVNLC